ncbi:M56 family metallopeptidase [Roseimaritima ulvae]|uniref:Regulatory protein BlaR1 n=1 Tax=Roseimaritima ulvae TaxID=980254 RepID=A0A5B9QNL5_9BACT|nr:M56 family metallopeptidase [Roseimaritima ulvae]QEG39075.1 Regulatory protein BlaR1 [Roseimaritima ulvae]
MVDFLSSSLSHDLFLTLVTFGWLQQASRTASPLAVSAAVPAERPPSTALTSPPAGTASPTADHNRLREQPSERQPSSHPAGGSSIKALATTQPYVLSSWLAGVLLSGVRLSVGIFGLFWMRSDRRELPSELMRYSQTIAARLGLGSARVFASGRTPMACVAGLLKPVVLLPTSWLSELPPDVLQAVISHELAHIRRWDTWVNLLQRVLETLLFYHPMVWWLSNRVRYEREQCCDSLAVNASGDRRIYIRALEQVGRLQVRGNLNLPPAFTGDRKMNLLSRVQHILRD